MTQPPTLTPTLSLLSTQPPYGSLRDTRGSTKWRVVRQSDSGSSGGGGGRGGFAKAVLALQTPGDILMVYRLRELTNCNNWLYDDQQRPCLRSLSFFFSFQMCISKTAAPATFTTAITTNILETDVKRDQEPLHHHSQQNNDGHHYHSQQNHHHHPGSAPHNSPPFLNASPPISLPQSPVNGRFSEVNLMKET